METGRHRILHHRLEPAAGEGVPFAWEVTQMNDPILWCRKYEVLFRAVAEDEELSAFFRGFDPYEPLKRHRGLHDLLMECFHEAYASGVVIKDYREVIEEGSLPVGRVARPTAEWLDSLSDRQVLACVAWHFRRDHFSEGSWIGESVADGHMLTLVRRLLKQN